MDLVTCPKCGNDWQGGEKCLKCGFVPIGAGLDKMKKKKRKRRARYVEPGSWRGFLTTGTFVGIGVFCFAYKPWQDDWEMMRALFGQGRHHSVVGEWEIVKTVALDKQKAILASNQVRKGTLSFSEKGQVKMSFQSAAAKTSAQGDYHVSGVQVALNKISTSETGAGQLPTSMTMQLAWTGPDTVVAACNGAEALYLRRRNKGNSLVKMIHMGIKPGSEDVPAGIQDMANKMTRGARNAGNE